ncbi:divergent polysaccharide deacetylase family protein [Maritalea mediterranea]|uniref:Divergent polysaccharide deacetylase family protein n=1 Tax=Maritalea mediterranea TaxID=2909667 RepID=A0ABS9E405_9HYPH|nr:divergent polysaccharide deacetylase family protein [Maritalea mediterranea]MCF4097532.1 divergent polysaccharide deacetylase family protein [Maritalea mediterranea]
MKVGGFPLLPISVAVLIIVIAVPVAWVAYVDSPLEGRPQVEVGVSSIGNNEFASNLSREVTNEDEAPDEPEEPINSPSFVNIDEFPDGAEAARAAAPRPELLEQTQHGYIPQVAADGSRPADVYARASITPASANNRGLVAIVVEGLGLSTENTRSAIDRLPDEVTLAFAPYGKEVGNLALEARMGGHEIMLQVPLEPFDYPQNDPGPQTLLVGQAPRANLDRLYWLMSRMGGYTGIINYLGARFTSSANDMQPILEEVALRGLTYLDDGASNRSLAPQLAKQAGVDFARADLNLDENPSRSHILRQLAKLEALALENGSAIATATSLPVTVRTIAEWADELDDKNLVLVPASALMQKN